MSLYDDIELPPTTKDEPVIDTSKKEEGKAPTMPFTPPNMAFLKTQLESRKAQVQFKLKPTAPVVTTTSAATFDTQLPAKKPSLLKAKRVQPLKIDATTTFSIIPKAAQEEKVFLFNEIMIEDEYNPMTPTDYHSFKAKREAQLAKERIAKEIAERIEREHAEELAKRGVGAAIAPPSFLMEQDAVVVEEPPVQLEPAIPKKDVVSNMMQRMGYKGFGLGKDEQGISTALTIKKVGKVGGVIVNQSNEPSNSGVPPPVNTMELLKNASKIVLVKNMVLLNDVDANLKGEIMEEMSKYGMVSDVVIHTITGAQEEEAVRIFVEYTNQAQAIKAVIDLNKRFFAGRVIRASFYSVDEFMSKNYDL